MTSKERWDNLPIEIQEFMLKEQVHAGNKKDKTVFEENFGSDTFGFNWYNSSKGDVSEILTQTSYNNYEPFFTKFPKGIKLFDSFPDKLKKIICEEQVLQGNEWDPQVFRENFSADKIGGGFDWNEAVIKGLKYSAIDNNNLYSYYELYPEEKPVTKKDVNVKIEAANMSNINKFDSFPIEIRLQMLVEQINAGNPFNIEVFQKNWVATFEEGGFNWSFENHWLGELFSNYYTDYYKKYPKIENNFTRLPEEIQIRALYNHWLNQDGYYNIYLKNINTLFKWGESPEGDEFWVNIDSPLAQTNFFKKYPKDRPFVYYPEFHHIKKHPIYNKVPTTDGTSVKFVEQILSDNDIDRPIGCTIQICSQNSCMENIINWTVVAPNIISENSITIQPIKKQSFNKNFFKN